MELLNDFVFRTSLKKELEERQKEMIKQGLKSRRRDFSFPVKINHDYSKLYVLFLKKLTKIFKKFTPVSNNHRCYVCVIDEKLYDNKYHDHIGKSTISGCFYLELPESSGGIAFLKDKKETIIKPNPFDLLIFPSNILHKPLKPKFGERRISVNVELSCEETAEQIFNETNYKEQYV